MAARGRRSTADSMDVHKNDQLRSHLLGSKLAFEDAAVTDDTHIRAQQCRLRAPSREYILRLFKLVEVLNS